MEECCVCFKENNIYKTHCGHPICPRCLFKLPLLDCPCCRRKISPDTYNLPSYLERNPSKFIMGSSITPRVIDTVWKLIINTMDVAIRDKEDYIYFPVHLLKEGGMKTCFSLLYINSYNFYKQMSLDVVSRRQNF